MPFRRPPIPVVVRLFAGLIILSQAGCMSALTTAAMREALRETIDSLAEASTADAPLSGQDPAAEVKVANYEASDEPAPVISEQPQPLSLDEAVERAVARLKVAGELDAPTQATLLSILEATRPEDWPAAIDAFASSLEAHRPVRARAAVAEPATVAVALEPPTAPDAGSQAEPTLAFPAPPPAPEEPARITVSAAARPVGPAPNPGVDDTSASPSAPVLEPVDLNELLPDATAATDSETPVADEPPSVAAAPQATLAVRNACFVSRVRAWGVVDRFSEAAFRPGQEVIVYFELDAPTARKASAGHATSIDTDFRMIAPDGAQVGQWDFEPIAETSHSPRRDYFARYIVRIPEGTPAGPHRLEFVVSDLVAGASTRAHLDLEVRP